MGIGDAVKPVKAVTADEFASSLADAFGIVTWGEAGAEADDKIAVTLQLKNPLEENLEKDAVMRLTCTTGATMALAAAGAGTVLDGTGTADMIIQLDGATGTFDLEVTDAATETCTVVAGATQGSCMLDCGTSKDLVFA